MITHSHRLETTIEVYGISKYDNKSSLPENRLEMYMLFIDKNTISQSPFSDVDQVPFLKEVI